MPFDPLVYVALVTAVLEAADSHDKGRALENLCEYLLQALDGVIVEERDIRLGAEEIDLVIWNAGLEDTLRPWDAVFLVEVKNWSNPVGAPALDSLLGKLRRRNIRTGILVAANGVTGDFQQGHGGDLGAVQILRAALQEGIRVIVITWDDLLTIQSLDDLRAMVRKKYCGLFVHKVL